MEERQNEMPKPQKMEKANKKLNSLIIIGLILTVLGSLLQELKWSFAAVQMYGPAEALNVISSLMILGGLIVAIIGCYITFKHRGHQSANDDPLVKLFNSLKKK